LDEKFEQFYGQYDDEWGSCDDDDDVTVGMATETDKQILDKVVEDFEKNFKENFKMLVNTLLVCMYHLLYMYMVRHASLDVFILKFCDQVLCQSSVCICVSS